MQLLTEMESLLHELWTEIPENYRLAEMGATLQFETTVFQEFAVLSYEDEMAMIDCRKEGIETRLSEIRAEIARIRPELEVAA